MGDWLLPSLRRAQGAEALARILPGRSALHVLHRRRAPRRSRSPASSRAGSPGRPEIVCAEHGYHGHVGFSLAMDEDAYSHWFRPLVPGRRAKVPVRRRRGGRAGGRRRHGGGVPGDDPGHRAATSFPGRRLPRARPPHLRRARRAADPRRGAGRSRAHRSHLGVRALGRRARPAGVRQGAAGGLYPVPPARSASGWRRSSARTRSSIRPASADRSSGRVIVEAVARSRSRASSTTWPRWASASSRLRRALPLLSGDARRSPRAGPDDGAPDALRRAGLRLARAVVRERRARHLRQQPPLALLIVMPPLVISADEVDEVLERLDAALSAMGPGNGHGR